jgi:hypothetical protein
MVTVAQRVAAGAAWLDEHEPGWDQHIDLDRLDLSYGCNCILGQLESPNLLLAHQTEAYWVGRSRRGLSRERAAELGFATGDYDRLDVGAYAALTAEWRRVLTARRAGGVS